MPWISVVKAEHAAGESLDPDTEGTRAQPKLVGLYLALYISGRGIGQFDFGYHFGSLLPHRGEARIDQMFSGGGRLVIDGGAAMNGDSMSEPEFEHGGATD